jgi:PAS domain S-box-containing protein
MTDGRPGSASPTLHAIARYSGLAVAALGLLVLIGWAANIPAIENVAPGLPTMVPNSALMFLLSGVTLTLLVWPVPDRKVKWVARILAIGTLVFALLTTVEYDAGVNLGIDRLILPASGNTGVYPGRSSSQSAFNFLLLSFAFLLIDIRWPKRVWIPQLLGGFAAFLAGAVLFGYAYGITAIYAGTAAGRGLSLHSALGFVVLIIGLECARPERSVVRFLAGRGPVGRLARRLTLAAVILPFLVGGLVILAARVGNLDPGYAIAILVVFLVAFLEVAILWTVSWLGKSDARRSEAEAALRSSEERFRSVSETANDAIVSADEQGRIAYLNDAAERIFGYRLEDALGEPLTMLMPERYHDGHRTGFARYMRTRQAKILGQTLELAGRRKDGSEFPLEVSIASWNASGRTFFTGVLRDVTERKLTEAALRQSEERFRLMVSNVKDYAILMLDPQGRVASWNEGAERIKGYRAEEIVGQHFSRFYPDEDVKSGKPPLELEEASKNGRFEDEGWRVRKDGSRFWANVVITALRDPDGNLRGFVKVTRDITERRKAQEEILRRSVELEASNKELEAFSYSVSHDLRAPLRSMDGFSQALLEDYRDKLDEHGVDYLDRVRAATQKMARLIDDMLGLARVSRAQMRIAPVDLSAMASSVANELRASDPTRQVDVEISAGLRADGDPGLLRVVLENLIANAWKFTSTKPAARIEFGSTNVDGTRAFFVRDDGVGFDMAYARKLFGAFQRLHTTAEFPGTGIGLATVARVIRRHGGRVWAEGEVGRGATFYFTIPGNGLRTEADDATQTAGVDS